MDVQKYRDKNMNEVIDKLNELGKTTSDYMMVKDSGTYPTLKGLKLVRPDIYNKYLGHANGKNLVAWDDYWSIGLWGFLVKPIKSAYRSASNQNLKNPYIISDLGYSIRNGEIKRIGFPENEKIVLNASEGETFTYPHNGKVMYKYTQEEISDLFKGKILGIDGWCDLSLLKY